MFFAENNQVLEFLFFIFSILFGNLKFIQFFFNFMTSRLHLLYKRKGGGETWGKEDERGKKVERWLRTMFSVIVLSVSGVPISVFFDCHRTVLVLLLRFAVLEQLSVYS